MTRVRVIAAALLGGVVLAAFSPSASAQNVPFTDSNARGAIAFCDANGNEVRSGNTGSAPFATYAVSSVAAPQGYSAKAGGRVALLVFQPIQYVDPGDWSGKQMGASSVFTNSAHPKSAQTVIDPALVDFVSVFPPHWDGLVQFRMYYSAPDKPAYTSTYPAAVVSVSGDTWTLVQGGGVPCNSGKAISSESKNLPKSVFNHPTPRSTLGASSTGSTQPGSSGGSGGSGSGATSGSGDSASSSSPDELAASPAGDAAPSSDGGGSGATPWIVLGVVLFAAALGGGWWWRRRAA